MSAIISARMTPGSKRLTGLYRKATTNSVNRSPDRLNVYTEEHYRRRGIARHLVNMLIEDACVHGATEISLDATESGRPLYESVGFKASEECMVIDIQQL